MEEEEMPIWDSYGRLSPNVTDLIIQAPNGRLYEATLGELSVMDLFTRRVLWAKLESRKQAKQREGGGLARLELSLAQWGVRLGAWILALFALELGVLIGISLPR